MWQGTTDMKKRTVIATGLLAAIIAAGCGSAPPKTLSPATQPASAAAQPAAPTGQQPLAATGTTTVVSSFAPIDTSTPPADQSVMAYPVGSVLNLLLLREHTVTNLDEQIQAQVAICMQAQGWTYVPETGLEASPGEDVTLSLADIAKQRQSIGYGIVQSTTLVTANDRYLQSLDTSTQAKYSAALGGDNQQGCTGKAQAAINDPLPFYQPDYQWTTLAFSQALRADPTVAAAQSQWSQCMAASGYKYTNSNDAQSSLRRELLTMGNPTTVDYAKLQAEEIAVATADTTCFAQDVQPVKIVAEKKILDGWVADGRLPSDLWPLS